MRQKNAPLFFNWQLNWQSRRNDKINNTKKYAACTHTFEVPLFFFYYINRCSRLHQRLPIEIRFVFKLVTEHWLQIAVIFFNNRKLRATAYAPISFKQHIWFVAIIECDIRVNRCCNIPITSARILVLCLAHFVFPFWKLKTFMFSSCVLIRSSNSFTQNWIHCAPDI